MTVVTIDGPAGSGKSTVARNVADRLGMEMLDTGAMYRSVTLAVLRSGADPTDGEAAGAAAAELELRMENQRVWVNGSDATDEIRSAEVSDAVSVVSAHPAVRTVLRDLQRHWMASRQGGVVEGRDIGTVVFPDAEVKVFLVAAPDVRASRRAQQGGVDESEAATNIATRDRLDATRADSPLTEPDGALRIDTSELTIDQVVDRIVEVVR